MKHPPVTILAGTGIAQAFDGVMKSIDRKRYDKHARSIGQTRIIAAVDMIVPLIPVLGAGARASLVNGLDRAKLNLFNGDAAQLGTSKFNKHESLQAFMQAMKTPPAIEDEHLDRMTGSAPIGGDGTNNRQTIQQPARVVGQPIVGLGRDHRDEGYGGARAA